MLLHTACTRIMYYTDTALHIGHTEQVTVYTFPVYISNVVHTKNTKNQKIGNALHMYIQ
jgi:hypothetical protein